MALMLLWPLWQPRLIRCGVVLVAAGLVALAVLGGMVLCDVLSDWIAKKAG